MNARGVPPHVLHVITRLKEAGNQAFLVGGCVRDLLLGLEPSDYDIATDAVPARVQEVFPRAVPIGIAFGTVLVPAPDAGEEGVHVTTLRADLEYVDGRRPEGVVFTSSVREDLSRRDFTINAMAWDPDADEYFDPFGGKADLEERVVRAVGDPALRLREDALRMLRAVRFAAQLGFDIDPETWRAVELEAGGVRRLSSERVRDELLRILGSPRPQTGLWILHELGLFYLVLPEFKGADRLLQAKRDAPTLLDHSIQAAANCPPDPILRFAGLFHDVGKLHTRTFTDDGRVVFHGHAKVGAEIAQRACRRLHLSKAETERVVSLVGMHMAVGGEVHKKTVRRWIGRYGRAWVQDLVALGRADWEASGWRGDIPDLDAVDRLVQEVQAEASAFSVADLAVDGHDVMRALGLAPGPIVGRILKHLYEAVLDDPEQNRRERLVELARIEAEVISKRE